MSIKEAILVSFSAGFLIENLMFTRGFGIDGILFHTHKRTPIMFFGLYVFTITIPACSLSWLVKNYVVFYAVPIASRPLIWLVCLCMVYCLHMVGLKILNKKRRNIHSDLLQVAAFSCAAFGTILLALLKNAGYLFTIFYTTGCIFGLLASMLVIHFGRERIQLSHVSAAFEGLPILLVYAGILSMAIYGLIGYQLPIA